MYPKLLILGNNCLSQTDSNGRTLGNLLLGWPKENLAQFYIQNAIPDFYYADNFFRVTDKQALNCFLGKRTYGSKIKKTLDEEPVVKAARLKKKNERKSTTMLIRDWVWNSKRWMNDDFWRWIDDFQPQVVLLQLGDCAFMIRLALEIAEKKRIPLALYNTEGYYYKDFDYFTADSALERLAAYPLFKQRFRRQFRKAMRRAACAIYNCETLREAYDAEFNAPSLAIYNGTETLCDEAKETERREMPIVSYLGNLGVGRSDVLLEVAETMERIVPGIKLDVYGRMPSQEIATKFERCAAIRYRGLASYDEVRRVMNDSDLLVHVENFDAFYKRDLKFAFSTKIADSLACGTCFLAYAPEECACSQYLRKNDGAYVATDPAELEEKLREILLRPDSRSRYRRNAYKLVEKNHNVKKNAESFRDAIARTMESAAEF